MARLVPVLRRDPITHYLAIALVSFGRIAAFLDRQVGAGALAQALVALTLMPLLARFPQRGQIFLRV